MDLVSKPVLSKCLGHTQIRAVHRHLWKVNCKICTAKHSPQCLCAVRKWKWIPVCTLLRCGVPSARVVCSWILHLFVCVWIRMNISIPILLVSPQPVMNSHSAILALQVFQRRSTGEVDFYKRWKNYVEGFGDPTGEFWLGTVHGCDQWRAVD